MISNLQKYTLKLIRRLYFYIEPLPFYWSPDFSSIIYSTQILPWFAWVVGQLLLNFYAFLCLYIVITHIWIEPRQEFTIMVIVTYLLMSCGVFGLQSVVFTILGNGRSFILGYIEMLVYEGNLASVASKENKELKKTQIKNKSRFLDCAVMAFTLFEAAVPPVVSVFCIITEWDAYYFVSQYYLPNPMYQTFFHIVSSMVIRFVILTITAAQFCQLISIVIPTAIIYMDSGKGVVRCLVEGYEVWISVPKMIRLYTQFYLIYNVIQGTLHTIVGLTLTAVFVAIVQTLWLSTVGYGQVEDLIYIIHVILSNILIGLTLSGFRVAINTLMASEKLLEKLRKDALTNRMLKQTKVSKWELMEIKSLKHLKVNYGPCFEMNSNSMAAYCMKLTDTWFSAVLLFG